VVQNIKSGRMPVEKTSAEAFVVQKCVPYPYHSNVQKYAIGALGIRLVIPHLAYELFVETRELSYVYSWRHINDRSVRGHIRKHILKYLHRVPDIYRYVQAVHPNVYAHAHTHCLSLCVSMCAHLREARLIHVWDMTHPCAHLDTTHQGARIDTHRDPPHIYVRHDPCICEKWHVSLCCSYVRHVSFICKTWLIHVRHDLGICETWLIQV